MKVKEVQEAEYIEQIIYLIRNNVFVFTFRQVVLLSRIIRNVG